MSAKPPPTPKYRLHKATGCAVVTLDGRDIYLGRHGTAESRAKYDELVARWLANGRRLPRADDAPLTVPRRGACGAFSSAVSRPLFRDARIRPSYRTSRETGPGYVS